jgi:hypothetical protein
MLILLMLCEALFIQGAYAQVLTVQADPAAVNYIYPAQGPGSSFYVNVTVSNGVQLAGYQSGFTFNATALQVTNVTDGDFLIKPGMVLGTDYVAFAGTIDNVNGKVSAYVVSLLNTLLNQSGSGTLFKVGFKVNPALTQNVTTPVKMMHFNITTTDPTALILTDVDGNLVTPAYGHITDGTFTLLGPVPEFSSEFFAALLVLATFAVALFSITRRSQKQKS